MLSKFTYFSHGNSNGFPTIDISSGITGLSAYHPVLSNLLVYVGTFSSTIYWYLAWLDLQRQTK